MKIRQLRRGIFLITTLMLIAFLVMLVAAIYGSVQNGFLLAGSLSNRELAKHAALNGLNFMQAYLETNCGRLAPAPDGAPATLTVNAADGSMTIVQQGYNVAGWMNNSNVTGPGEQSISLMYQASFNQSYAGYSASTTPPPVNGIQLPAMPYVSMNNLLRPALSTTVASSYKSGVTYQSVPGQIADIIVMGYAVAPDGRVLSSRLAEGMFSIAQVGQYAPAGAVAQSDVDLTLISPLGQIDVGIIGNTPGAYSGLASYAGNINTVGQVPMAGGTAPPVYNSSSKVGVNGSGQFTYQGPAPGSAAYPGDTTPGAPPPPTIAPSTLPGLSHPTSVTAGTWVIWGSPAALYHYPMDYSTVGMSGGSPVPVQNLPWTQAAPASPPALNGVTPDQGPLTTLDSSHQLTLTPTPSGSTAGNSITVTANDINVAAAGGINSFALLVAPSQTNGGLTVAGSAAANGNAQLVFQPGATQSSIQFRSAGTITVMGNVTGAGSLQATGTGSDVNVIGKSTLDGRADSGVALYATGNVNVWGAVDASGNTLAQLPSSVGPYVPILQTNPQNVTGAMPGPVMNATAASQMVSDMEYGQNGVGNTPPFPPVVVGQTYPPTVGAVNYGYSYSGSNYIVNTDPAGSSNNSQLVSLVISNGSYYQTNYPQYYTLLAPVISTWNSGNHVLAQAQFMALLASAGFVQIDATHMMMPKALADSVDTSGAPLPSSSPSTGPSGGPLPSFDQSFNGLVYAANNFQASTNGSFTVNGGLISNAGKITVDSSNITLNYNAASIGQFAGLFGDHVTLARNTVTVY